MTTEQADAVGLAREVTITVKVPQELLARIDSERARRVVGRGPLLVHLLEVGLTNLAPWPPEPAPRVGMGLQVWPACGCGHAHSDHGATMGCKLCSCRAWEAR